MVLIYLYSQSHNPEDMMHWQCQRHDMTSPPLPVNKTIHYRTGQSTIQTITWTDIKLKCVTPIVSVANMENLSSTGSLMSGLSNKTK